MATQAKKEKFNIAVRDFAVPISQQGSLGSVSHALVSVDNGQAIHSSIQERLGIDEQYQAELPLQASFKSGRYEFFVRGRCDGFFKGESPLLEEIKSSLNLETLKRSLGSQYDHPYILQAKLYAYLFFLKNSELPQLRLRLVCARTMDEELYQIDFDPEEFEKWLRSRCEQIEKELDRYYGIVKARKKLGKKLIFPFTAKRPFQESLLQKVATALEAKKHLLLQAPTGLGKTAGVLIPALQFALTRGSPVVYIAPKNSQFKAAVDLIKELHRRRIGLKILVLTARQKSCRNEKVACHESSCVYAREYFTKVQESLLRQRDAKQHLWDQRYFQDLSTSHEICPYEISLERVREADLIVCDYNYIFSPRANFLERYSDPIIPVKDPVLVIDEAHNLYERVMENYSPQIRESTLQMIFESEDAKTDPKFRKLVAKGIELLRAAAASGPQAKVEIDTEALHHLIEDCRACIMCALQEGATLSNEDPVIQFFGIWSDLAAMLEWPRDQVPLIFKSENGDGVLRALCVDPSPFMKPIYPRFLGVVAFSATLKPFDFYLNMSGFDEASAETVEFNSPFPRENKKVMIIPQILTNYRERVRHYHRIAVVIQKIAEMRPGSYLVFFSSYQFLQKVYAELRACRADWQYFTQTAAMTHAQMEKMWNLLEGQTKVRLILAVQGGSLSEGIDFRGRGLQGVFVVGPAIPSSSFERQLMQEYFEKRYGNGRSYAYVYPAMAKSIQAAGRVVRDEDERGVIVLLDPRFLEADFQSTMPADWFALNAEELVPRQILAEVEAFWQNEAVCSAVERQQTPRSDVRL